MPPREPSTADDPEAVARALRAGQRRVLVMVGGNALLLLLMLGGPYLRGHLRTRALWPAFGRFAACVYGGKLSPEPGLGMPVGEEAHFAARLLAHEPTWPAECDGALAALAPDEAIFILPGLKRAEQDLRQITSLVKKELSVLPARTPGARFPRRPLRAIAELRSALARHALAAGEVDVPQTDAFSLRDAPALPVPTRVPLYAGSDAPLTLWGNDSELSALAVDRRGVSFVSVHAGVIDQTRFPRPKLLQQFLPQSEGGLFAWAMPEARCRERAAGCASKAMGLGRVQLPLSALPTPRWLASHPASRLDRSVAESEGHVLVAAQTTEGAVEVRQFELSGQVEQAEGSELPPLLPSATWKGVARGQALLLDQAGGEPLALVAAETEGRSVLTRLTPDQAHPLLELAGAGPAWTVGCTRPQGADLAFGNTSALALAEIDAQGALRSWEAALVATPQVVDPSDGAHDNVVRLCTDGGALALVRDANDRLLSVACRDGAPRCRIETLARDVRLFAALVVGKSALVAYAGAGELVQVRVQRLNLEGQPEGEARVPAACWSPAGGLCGAPTLARVGARLLLAAREGADLLVLESADDGQSWEPLRGIRKVE